MEGPSRQFHQLPEEAENLALTRVVPRHTTPAGDVVRDVVRCQAHDGSHVTFGERVVNGPHHFLVGICHFVILPLDVSLSSGGPARGVTPRMRGAGGVGRACVVALYKCAGDRGTAGGLPQLMNDV